MPRTHPSNPPEFRAEAVRLARGSPRPGNGPGRGSEALRLRLRQTDADDGWSQPGDRTADERGGGSLLPLATLCHVLAVDRSVYHAWASRRASARRVRMTAADPAHTPAPPLVARDRTAPRSRGPGDDGGPPRGSSATPIGGQYAATTYPSHLRAEPGGACLDNAMAESSLRDPQGRAGGSVPPAAARTAICAWLHV